MCRTLVLLLLAFLPIQFSWAAVTTYCQHEARSGASHLGHHEYAHEHQHQHEHPAQPGQAHDVDTAAGSAAQAATDAATDTDCGHCHGHCHCVAIPSLQADLLGAAATAPQRTSSDAARGAHASARPERPQWARLA